MGRFKVAQKEPAPRRIQHPHLNKQYFKWKDIKSYFPLLDVQYSFSVAGMISVIVTIWAFSKVNQVDQSIKQESNELNVNLSQRPYVYDHVAAQIQRKSHMENYPFNYLITGIDRRTDLTLQEFWDVYDAKWPVVLTDVMNDWPARKWSTEFFNSSYGEDRVVMKAVHGTLDNARGLALPLSLFIKHLNDSAPKSWTYLEDELFLPRRPELYKQVPRNLYTEEDFFRLFPKEIQPWDCMLLWGTAHSRSTLHIDPYNWTGTNAVLKGLKKWKLFPPGQDDLLYVLPDRSCGFPLDCFKYNSPIDTFDLDIEKYPKYKDVQFLELDLIPGEFLIIPPGWFHQAYNVEETMAVSGQFMNRNNYLIVMEEIIKADNLKRGRLPSYFHTLMPPDQITYLISKLPKAILKKGKARNQEVIDQLQSANQKKKKEEESRKNKSKSRK